MVVKTVSWDEYYAQKLEDEEQSYCQLLRYSEKIDELEKRKDRENDDV